MPARRPSVTPDVIVVGAGTAGCVVAANLAAAGLAVELIEAGPPADRGVAARSVDWLAIQQDPERRWRDLVVDRGGAGPEPYVVGRGVGGGSAINGMLAATDAGLLVAGLDRPLPGLAEAMDRVATRWATVAASPGPFGARLIEASLDAGWTAGPVELAVATAEDGTLHRHVLSTGMRSVSVVTDTAVRRCVFRDTRDRESGLGPVTGVELADGSVRSAGRVILCAGAIHTPAILLRSLANSGASSVASSANPHIGIGLADHPSRVITVDLGPQLRAPRGVLAPITARVQPPGAVGESGLVGESGVEVLLMDHTGDSNDGRRHGAVIVMLMNPVSAGSVRLGSDEESVHADLGLLGDPRDRARLDDAVERTRRLLDEAIGSPGELQPGFGPVSHVAASCRFGSAVGDGGDVVGLDGVAVMDASAFPGLPTAHPMLPTMALAEAFSAEWLRRAGIGNHPSQ